MKGLHPNAQSIKVSVSCNLHCGGIRQLFFCQVLSLFVSQISTIDVPIVTPLKQWQSYYDKEIFQTILSPSNHFFVDHI